MYKPIAREQIAENQTNDFYWQKVRCSNCELDQSLAFTKGDKVEIHSCPNCECLTLIKK